MTSTRAAAELERQPMTLDDVPAVIAALRDGPVGYQLPLVAKALGYTNHAVGGPLWDAINDAVRAGIVRIIPYSEQQARGLPDIGFLYCEDIR